MTHEVIKELQSSNAPSVLCSINTDLKSRSRTKVSKQDPDPIVAQAAQSSCKHSSTSVHAILSTHRNHCPVPCDLCL